VTFKYVPAKTVGQVRIIGGFALNVDAMLALTRYTDWQRAFLDAGRAGLFGGPSCGTLLTGRFHALGSVRSSWTRFAFSFDAQVHAVRALVPAFLRKQRRPRSRLTSMCSQTGWRPGHLLSYTENDPAD